MLRRYDEAIFNWAVFSLRTKSGNFREVPKIFSTPDRAFVGMAEYMDTAFPKPDGAKRDINDVTLPLISVARIGDPELDFERFNMVRTKVGFSEDFNFTAVAPHPDPYTLSYQIDIWVKRQRQIDSIITQYLKRFVADLTVIKIPLFEEDSEYRQFGTVPPVGTCELFNDGINDNSDLEPGDNANRHIRKSFSLRANAWLIKDYVMKPTVRNIMVSFEDDVGTLETAEYDENTLVTF